MSYASGVDESAEFTERRTGRLDLGLESRVFADIESRRTGRDTKFVCDLVGDLSAACGYQVPDRHWSTDLSQCSSTCLADS